MTRSRPPGSFTLAAVSELLSWAGLTLALLVLQRHLTSRIRPDEIQYGPVCVLAPWQEAFTRYAVTGVPAALMLAAGAWIRWKRKTRAGGLLLACRWTHRLSILLLAGILLLEIVLVANPLLLGDGLDVLPERGAWLFDETGDPRRRFDEREVGYLYQPDLSFQEEILVDELIRRNLVEGVTRLPETRFVRFRTDARGFRGPDPRAGDRVKVVTLGGDHTAGALLDEERLYPRLLEQLLDAHVLNLGVEGHCPTQQVRVFERHGLPARPALALLEVDLGRSPEDEARFLRFDESGLLWNRFLFEKRPRLDYCLLRAVLARDKPRGPVRHGLWSRADLPSEPQEVPLDTLFSLDLEATPGRSFALDPLALRRLATERTLWEQHEGFRRLTAALLRFRDLCREGDIRPLVVLFPPREAVLVPLLAGTEQRERLQRLVATAGDPTGESTLAAILERRRALSEALIVDCEASGIPVFDLGPWLQQRLERGGAIYLPFAPLLSPDGQTLLAKMVLTRLRELGWSQGIEGEKAFRKG